MTKHAIRLTCRRSLVALALLTGVLAAGALASCGDDRDRTSFVDVALAEWEITPEVTSVPAGPVRFTATNAGTLSHELVIIKTDLPPNQLPTREDGSVDEGRLEVIGRVRAVAPGAFERSTLTLGPGSYALICNIVDAQGGESRSYYELGMHTAFTVFQADE
jgi:uncharacterized cupredoxin-like copper-binding protein